ncbi:Phytocyanin domain [Dillenia turbinata]|uniref:Phytocyanin domain n=1 Tax=Dillenia turbinata TaxID=194707 RepID=A0AAN8VPH5_9MAGN
MAKVQFPLLMLVALGCIVTGPASAMTHVVGGSFGWKLPPNKTFYEEWAAPRTFGVGDRLLFPYRMPLYSLIEVGKDDFPTCGQSQVVERFFLGPTTVDLNNTGERFFYDGVGLHCEAGLKLRVNVVNAPGSSGSTTSYYERLFGSEAQAPAPSAAGEVKSVKSSDASSFTGLAMVSALVSFMAFMFIYYGKKYNSRDTVLWMSTKKRPRT